MRSKRQYRILYGFFRKRCVGLWVAGYLFSRIPMQGQTDGANLVKGNRVSVCNCERGTVRPAIYAANCSLANSLDTRLWIQYSASRTTPCHVGVSKESPGHHLIVSG